MAVITAKVVLEHRKEPSVRNAVLGAPCSTLCPAPHAEGSNQSRSQAAPFGACTPPRHRAQPCPTHWGCWSKLCQDPASSTCKDKNGSEPFAAPSQQAHKAQEPQLHPTERRRDASDGTLSAQHRLPTQPLSVSALTSLASQTPCCLPARKGRRLS